MRVFAVQVDNSSRDITEGVKTLYDLVIGSLDFRSGFMSSSEMIEVADLAHACGFDPDAPRSYLIGKTEYLKARGAHYEQLRQEAAAAKDWLDTHQVP